MIYLWGSYFDWQDSRKRITLRCLPAIELEPGLFGIWYHGQQMLVRGD